MGKSPVTLLTYLNKFALRVLPLSGGGGYLPDEGHTKIHQGELFTLTTSLDTIVIPANSSLDLLIIPDDGNFPHVMVEVNCDQDSTFQIMQVPKNEISLNGEIPIELINYKWSSNTSFKGVAYINPTLTATPILKTTYPLFSDDKQNTVEQLKKETDSEIIVDDQSAILFRLFASEAIDSRGFINIDTYNSGFIPDKEEV